MYLYNALPPELYEIINATIALASFLAWLMCVRYLIFEFRDLRRQMVPIFDAISNMMRYRLAIALTVICTGEWIRMGWLWLARFISNTHHEPGWMGTVPWVFIPVVSSLIAAAGFVCVVRAIWPRRWGNAAYSFSLMAITVIICFTQIYRQQLIDMFW